MTKFLITSDWHIRSDIPTCRIDDFQKTQKKVLKQISRIAQEKHARIIIAGDIFDNARPEKSQELEIMLYQIFKENTIYFIAGQHDLLYHKNENFCKGSIGVIANYDNWLTFSNQEAAIDSCFLRMFNYDVDIIDCDYEKDIICVLHKFISEQQLPFFIKDKDGFTAQQLLNKFNYNLFVTGDNHHGFIYEKNNRFVINPGCITRQKADMKKYKPFVVLFDIETKKHEKIYLCDDDVNTVTTHHLDATKAKKIRMDTSLKKLEEEINLDYSFEENIIEYLLKNKTNKNIKTKILQALGEKDEN